METWCKVTILLSVVGFLKEIRPIEPFIFEYLTGPLWWNLTAEEVQQYVFPVSTYSYLSMLIVVFLFTDLFRYKPFVVLLGATGAATFSLLLWGNSFTHLVVLEICYGTMLASEVAYFTYIYAKVSKDNFGKVTAYARAAVLAGRCISATLAQGLTQLKWMNYMELNYITVSALVAASVWSLLLPPVKTSIYFHQNKNTNSSNAFHLMKVHFTESFSKPYVIKWSIWWALATCGYMLIYMYSQPLWSLVQTDTTQLHNGTVEAIMTLVSCLSALLVGYVRINWMKWSELVISVSSVVCGILLLICWQTDSIVVCYLCYILFCAIYHCVITVATSEVSKHILEDSYGLVFGLNTFIALGLQTILVLLVITGDLGWALDPKQQHIVYGFYHIGITIVFVALYLCKCLFHKRESIIINKQVI